MTLSSSSIRGGFIEISRGAVSTLAVYLPTVLVISYLYRMYRSEMQEILGIGFAMTWVGPILLGALILIVGGASHAIGGFVVERPLGLERSVAAVVLSAVTHTVVLIVAYLSIPELFGQPLFNVYFVLSVLAGAIYGAFGFRLKRGNAA